MLGQVTRDRGSARSASAHRRGGERFESQLNTASLPLKMVPTATLSFWNINIQSS